VQHRGGVPPARRHQLARRGRPGVGGRIEQLGRAQRDPCCCRRARPTPGHEHPAVLQQRRRGGRPCFAQRRPHRERPRLRIEDLGRRERGDLVALVLLTSDDQEPPVGEARDGVVAARLCELDAVADGPRPWIEQIEGIERLPLPRDLAPPAHDRDAPVAQHHRGAALARRQLGAEHVEAPRPRIEHLDGQRLLGIPTNDIRPRVEAQDQVVPRACEGDRASVLDLGVHIERQLGARSVDVHDHPPRSLEAQADAHRSAARVPRLLRHQTQPRGAERIDQLHHSAAVVIEAPALRKVDLVAQVDAEIAHHQQVLHRVVLGEDQRRVGGGACVDRDRASFQDRRARLHAQSRQPHGEPVSARRDRER
jgi:hypothetical protein